MMKLYFALSKKKHVKVLYILQNQTQMNAFYQEITAFIEEINFLIIYVI